MHRGTLAAAAVAAFLIVPAAPAQAAKPGVLATGDSMIQYVDVALKRQLRKRARVRSDAHISTGLSKPCLLELAPVRARARCVAYRPRVTVVFLGANDGFPMPRSGGAGAVAGAWSAASTRAAPGG